jgi:hypothetical protein
MIHAITPFGPLCEREDNNKPVDDLEWRGDTCHPKTKHEIEYIDLPNTVERLAALSEMGEFLDDVQYIDDEYCRVAFNVNKFKQRSSASKPFIPNLEELKMGIIKYIKNNKPDLLECLIEKKLNERGHRILWTPPYSPDLQPIELFWAAGKNHARLFARN